MAADIVKNPIHVRDAQLARGQTCASLAQPQAIENQKPIPRILVLVAAYNGRSWIREQIESILSQQAVELHVVIRDDGSLDGTLEEIDRFGNDPRVARLASTASSGSAAQNFFTLIRETSAQGFDFVAFSDQDDIWYPDRLARAIQALKNSRLAGYSSATLARWGNGRERHIAPSGRPNRSDFLFEGAGQGCTFVLTADFYDRVRSFISAAPQTTRNLHFHDWAIYALARTWGVGWTFDYTPTLIYRQHDDNDTGARGTITSITKRLALLRGGWYKQQLEQISLLCSTAAPQDARIAAWRAALQCTRGWRRTAFLLRFCLSGGRRRALDNCVLLIACVAGWL